MSQLSLPRLLLVSAALALPACGPLVQIGGKATPPRALYTLTADGPASAAAGIAPVPYAETIGVAIPAMPGALQTARVPVQVTDTSIQYLTTVEWSEQPNRLFQRLLADTLRNAGLPVIDMKATGRHGARYLTGELLAFGVDLRGGRNVRVRYDATLTTSKGLRQRSFERSAPIDDPEGPEVADALNAVANKVAHDVQEWLSAG